MKFEELMNIIEDEVSKVMKSPLTEPDLPAKAKQSFRETALKTEEEIDDTLFIQDDIKRLEKEEKKRKQKI